MWGILRSLSASEGGGSEPAEPTGADDYSKDETHGGMFLLMCLAIGLLTRNVLAPKLPFPYTVRFAAATARLAPGGGDQLGTRPPRAPAPPRALTASVALSCRERRSSFSCLVSLSVS